MYNNTIDDFFGSAVYSEMETDSYYLKLIDLLKKYLPEDVYLEAEELLNLELIIKVEVAFEAGRVTDFNELRKRFL